MSAGDGIGNRAMDFCFVFRHAVMTIQKSGFCEVDLICAFDVPATTLPSLRPVAV